MERDVQEIKDRCRRIETRLTKFLESQGFDTQRKLPVFRGNVVEIPSMECSIADILSAMPGFPALGHDNVIVQHKGVPVAILTAVKE